MKIPDPFINHFTLKHMKTIIIDIAPPKLTYEELEHRMVELESLVSTYG